MEATALLRSWLITSNRRGGRTATFGLVCGLVFVPCSPTLASSATYRYRGYFRIEQCGAAINLGHRLVRHDASSFRGSIILAEGLLCRGVHGDDWALEDSITLLREIVTENPRDFFSTLALADALRERYPYSIDAEEVFERSRELVEDADLGAARGSFVEYIDTKRRDIERSRSSAAKRLLRTAASFERTSASTDGLGEFLLQLSRTGERGALQALERLDAYLPLGNDDPSALYYRAEILRGRATRAAVAKLYAKAIALDTPPKQKHSTKIAELAELRLRRLRAWMQISTQTRTGGLGWINDYAQ